MGEKRAFQLFSPGLGSCLVPRLVIRTPQQQVVFDQEVEAHLVIGELQQWLGVLSPAAIVEVDGVLVSEADKARVCPDRPTAPTTSQDVLTYAQHLNEALNLVRKGELDLLAHCQQRTRELADEQVRQRQLMHRCLVDCDAVDRAVLGANVRDHFATRIQVAAAAAGGRPAAPAAEEHLTAEDFMRGVSKLLAKGNKQ